MLKRAFQGMPILKTCMKFKKFTKNKHEHAIEIYMHKARVGQGASCGGAIIALNVVKSKYNGKKSQAQDL